MSSILSQANVMHLAIEPPPTLVSPLPSWVMLTFFGVTALGSAAAAAYWSYSRRDWLPIVCVVSAMVCALNEPIFDVLGKIVYADNAIIAFNAFGRDIPLFLVIGYIAWVGVLPYVIARGMQAGWSPKVLYTISVVDVSSVVVVEIVNRFIHGWKYYGEAPLNYFGGVAAMASVPLAGGFLLFALAFPLEGWKRLATAFFIPVFSLPMMFAATGWPLYLALHSDYPTLVNYLAVAGLLILIVAINIGIVTLTKHYQTCRLQNSDEGEGAHRAVERAPEAVGVRA
ncbi:hypothetical protein [Gordonia rubripertincta]|uniref:hypothetical protein n=1 Tax=Gordonia rubripertincta TaxID=36822 RepID=UPI000B8D6B37|nr:hypothetical protein [Gordonia rubripertincta]ASR01217.1 hypothetical protein GCWB2_01935 [Gordonia rubripertincta]